MLQSNNRSIEAIWRKSLCDRKRGRAMQPLSSSIGTGIIDLAMSDGPAGSTAHPSIRDRLLLLIGQILGKPEAAASLPTETRLSELGMSSIKMVNLMLAVETEFDLTIPQGDITPDNFRSVATVEALVARLLAVKS
jgi:acyl carrier protein